MYVFLERSFTALITLSYPSYNSSAIPMFHLLLCLSSPFINATSPTAISICLWLFFILCLSLRERKYSLFRLFQAASLQRLIYRCRFLITLSSSSSSSSSNCSFVIVIYFPRIRMFGVNTRYWISSSIFISGRLFKLISVPSITSPSSCFVSFALLVALYKHCFTSHTILSNCPPHHGALLRLNFHLTCSVT